MKKSLILLTITCLFGLGACQKEEAPIEPATAPAVPQAVKVKWKFGVKLDLWKPRYNCLRGIGICRLNSIFVEFDFTARVAPVDVGYTPGVDDVRIVFRDQVPITQYMGQNFITVEPGDENIDVSQDILDLFGLPAIRLKQGVYNIQLDPASGNQYVDIDILP